MVIVFVPKTWVYSYSKGPINKQGFTSYFLTGVSPQFEPHFCHPKNIQKLLMPSLALKVVSDRVRSLNHFMYEYLQTNLERLQDDFQRQLQRCGGRKLMGATVYFSFERGIFFLKESSFVELEDDHEDVRFQKYPTI